MEKKMDKQTEAVLTKNLDALTEGAKLAIIETADAFRFGGNWGFIKRTDRAFKEKLSLLAEEKKNIKAIPVSNGALILANPNFLAHNVNLAVPNALGVPFAEKVKQRREEERQRFNKFIDKVAKGKSTHVKSAGGFYELEIGIFSINDTNRILLDGKDYPAYKLDLIEALEFANQLTNTGRKVLVRAETEDGREVYDEIKNLAFNSKGTTALYRGLVISETDTGVFLKLRIV